MSAWLVTTTHIRVLVSAMFEADRSQMVTLPALPAAITNRHPETFAALVKHDQHILGRLPVCAYEDEIGRAMLVANILSLRARYPHDRDHAANENGALGYRHAMLDRDPVMLLKSFRCWAYQCAEDNDAAREWARAVEEAMKPWLISRLPGFDAAPWGIDDPPEGVPEPGTRGAPVSLLSMMAGR